MNDATLPRTGDSGPADIGIVEDRFFTIRDLPLCPTARCCREATIAYETYGRLAPHGRNAVLVTHGFTGSHHAAGRNPANGSQPGSWDGLIGPGKPIDTDRLFVVASNMLGSSYGSTNAASVNPATGKPYGPDFPAIAIARHRRRAESAAAIARRRASGRGRRPVLWRLPGVPVGRRLPRFHGCDRAGQHRALGLGQYRQAARRSHRAARDRPRLAGRPLSRHRARVRSRR